jgi:hypothetical protein
LLAERLAEFFYFSCLQCDIIRFLREHGFHVL